MTLGTPFRVDMLGGLALRQGNREIRQFRTQKTAALLAYLAFYKGRSHPRDVLIELLWPDSAVDAGRSNLSVALNALRRRLEEPGTPPGAVLIADRSQVRLNPGAFTTDVEEFEGALHEAEGETDTDRGISARVAALELYNGDLLPGFYEEWTLAERDRLRDCYLSALTQVIKGCVEARQYHRALEYAHRKVQADPLREVSYHSLMRLYLAVGRPEEALRQYETLERLLEQELQTKPSAPLRELAEKVRGTAPTRQGTIVARAPESRGRAPESRGQAPESRGQAPESRGHAQAPAQPSPETPRPASRIPLRFTRCFGRESEIARLTEMIGPVELSGGEGQPEPGSTGDGTARLITLTGPGGTGKTRLSIEVAWRLKDAFSGGVRFVPLEEVREPLRMGEALRDALELPRLIQTAALDQVIAYLSNPEREWLLVLDNFEQLTAGGAPIVWTLLNRVPLLRLLVTSRQRLSLPGEREIPVLPLPIPTAESAERSHPAAPDELMKYPSVALFVDRAQATRPEFQITLRNADAIAAICRDLEGIPLAIELAAARARVLTPSQVLARLTERFELLESRKADKGDRHRSLWAAIDWSYHLLPPGLRQFFARLSVFRGGWSLEAAEAICEEPAALEYLGQLRGCSMVSAEESSSTIRFRMLESLREFGAEQLTPEEIRGIERRHAEYFHEWVAGTQLTGQQQLAWYARFEEDLDNLRAALDWSLQPGNDIEVGLEIAGSLVSFWRVRGHLSEGREWYDRLLAQAGDTPTRGLAFSLYGAGALASLIGDAQTAGPLLERCMETAMATDDRNCLALVHNEMGTSAYRRGDFEKARAHYVECLSLAREQGAQGRIASALTNLASVAQTTGDFVTSQSLNAESLAIWRETGDRVGEARVLHNLANLALSERRLDEARRRFEESLQIKRELSDHYGIGASLGGIMETAIYQGDYAAAFECARESLALNKQQQLRTHLLELLHLMAELSRAIGESETAARLFAAMEQARKEMNYPMPPINIPAYEQAQVELRETLGAAVFEAARSGGETLTMDQALEWAEEVLTKHFL